MTKIDPLAILSLSRAASDLGHYNLAKLLTGAVAAAINRELYAGLLPKTDQEVVDAVAAIEPVLHEAESDQSLLAGIQHARLLISANQLVLYPDSPPLYVCRVCGEVAWHAAPEHCPHCGAGTLVYQYFAPAFYLEPEPAPLVLSQLARTPAWLSGILNGLTAEQVTRQVDGTEGAWSLLEAAGHLLDTQELIAQRVAMFFESERPDLNAKAMWQRVEAARLTAAEIAMNFRLSRESMISRLRTAPPEMWQHVGQHSEFGPVTLLQQCTYFAKHEQWHMAQITRIRQALAS